MFVNTVKSIWKTFRKAFQHYPWDYMLLILVAWVIPAAYGLLNRYFIGYMSYESVVVDQSYEAVEVSLEVLLEMFPLAVLALVAWDFKNKESATRIVKTALIMQLVITMAFIAFLTLLAGIGVCINFALDAVFISNFPFSLKLGLIGSALDNVVANVVLFLIAGVVFWWLVRKEAKMDMKVERDVAKSIFRIGRWTGMESLVRNAGYIIGVIAVVNFIGINEESAIGGYNTAMWVMWSITLIPVLAWTEATNVAIGNAYGKKDYQGMRDIQKVSIIIVGTYMVSWALLGNVIWGPISSWLNGGASNEIIDYSITTFHLLIIPYILFSIGSCLKSFFIGTGKPFWIFFTSMIVNIGIYVPLGLMVKASMHL